MILSITYRNGDYPSNYGNLVSANKLAGIVSIKSPKTVLEYMSYFEEAYLINRIPKYS